MKNISKSVGLAAAMVALACAGPAFAQYTAAIGGGAQSGATYVNFDSLSAGATSFSSGALTVGFTGNAGTAVSGVDTYASAPPWLSGDNNVFFESPSTLPSGGEADTTPYLFTGSTGGGGSLTFNFSTPETYFGLVWGSIDLTTTTPDDENLLKFYNGSTLIETVTAEDLLAENSAIDNNGTQSGLSTAASGTAYVNIDTPSAFTSVEAATGHFTFEIDNVAYANYSGVPDGGMTVGLLGGALVGLQALHRRLRG